MPQGALRGFKSSNFSNSHQAFLPHPSLIIGGEQYQAICAFGNEDARCKVPTMSLRILMFQHPSLSEHWELKPSGHNFIIALATLYHIYNDLLMCPSP